MVSESPPASFPRPPWYRGLWWQILLLVVALAILLHSTWLATSKVRDQLASTLDEQNGAHEVYTLYEAMNVLGKLRAHLLLSQGGDPSLTPAVEELFTEFRLFVRGILAEDHVRGFRIADTLEMSLSRVQGTQTMARSDPLAAFQHLGEIELDFIDMMTTVADHSGLALDPEANGHYLTDVMIAALPALNAQMDTLRGLLAYSLQSAAHARQADLLLNQELFTYTRLSLRAQHSVGMLREYQLPNFQRNADRFADFETALMDNIARYADAQEKNLASARHGLEGFSKANTILFDLFNELYGDLHIQLEKRLGDLHAQLNNVYFGTAIAVLLIVALAVLSGRRQYQFSRSCQSDAARIAAIQRRVANLALIAPRAAPPVENAIALELPAFLADTVLQFRKMPAAQHITTELREKLPAVRITSDGPRLRQLILDILQIAAERAPLNTPVAVRAEAIDPRRVAIIIKDLGPAITEPLQEVLFDPYAQALPDNALPIGARIVFAATQAFLTRQQGHFDIVSDSDGGTSYFLELPCGPA